MRFFVLTDLEGVAGIDSFAHTRSADDEQKAPAMAQLGREVNACVEGIRSVYPAAEIDVWDGHGSGGLHEEDVDDANYLGDGRPYFDLNGFDAMLFVGQHAMAGTVDAPLRHTYSSRSIAHYKLNGTFIGEFGCRALIAGRQGVPTIYLSGDDKAVHEAEMFIPEITTTVTKEGLGEEAADHLDQDVACERIRADVRDAVERFDEIPPYSRFEPPYELEIRFYEPVEDGEGWWSEDAEHVRRIDDRTVRLTGDNVVDPHEEFFLAF